MKTFIATLLLAVIGTAEASPLVWQPGVHYTVLHENQPGSRTQDTVEVVEVFSYTCRSCMNIEPHIEAWLKNKPAYVHFSRVPVSWNEKTAPMARLHYALEMINRPELRSAIFEAVNAKTLRLVPFEASTMDQLVQFLEKHNVDGAKFRRAFESPETQRKVDRAGELMKEYQIAATPTIVINGRLATRVEQAQELPKGSREPLDYQNFFALINELSSRERQRHTRTAAAGTSTR